MAVTFYGSGSGTGTESQTKESRHAWVLCSFQSQSRSSELRAYLALLNNFHDHETQLKLEPWLSNRPTESSISGRAGPGRAESGHMSPLTTNNEWTPSLPACPLLALLLLCKPSAFSFPFPSRMTWPALATVATSCCCCCYS